jgi:predicted nucleotidyltransferase
MRLNPEDVAVIKRLVAEAYGPDAVIRLFGSRADDRRRGGDVDLHVTIPARSAYTSDDLWTELRLGTSLETALDERKVDLIVRRSGEPETPIDRIAMATGVVL